MRRVLFLTLLLGACGPDNKRGDDAPDAMGECSEDSHRCEGSTWQSCVGGMWQNAIDCPSSCNDMLGCVDCVPGTNACKDGNVWTCGADGMLSTEVQQCTGSNVCIDGACVDACADAAASKSYLGCEYWAVDLDNAVEVFGDAGGIFGCMLYPAGTVTRTMRVCYNAGSGEVQGQCDPQDDGMAPNTCPTNFTCTQRSVCVLDAQRSPFAVVVSNPQSKDVNVTLTGPGGQTIMRTIPAGQVASILPQMNNAIPDQSVEGSVKTKNAYKITSNLPIIAYQFNPLDNANVFSNDASLLIPRTAFDTDYYVMSYPTLDRRTIPMPKDRYYGYLTVVAWQDNTQITVTPTVPIMPGQTQSAIAANTPTNFTLNAFEVLQLQAAGAGDLTGTHVVSTNMTSFGVFGGHEAGYIPDPNPPAGYPSGPCCADHLEEMMFPSTTWGKAFAITRSETRANMINPPDLLRVLAQKAGTAVTFKPAATPVSGNCGALAAGQFCEVYISTDTEIESTEPILVGHYLLSAIWNNGSIFAPMSVGSGDPSMAIAPPSEQFRTDYTILVPSQYANNYVSIAARATGGVTVDGTAVTLTPFTGGGTHRAARVPLTAGQHKIKCADGCGITVYGYHSAVSYMFAGGLDLKPIVIL